MFLVPPSSGQAVQLQSDCEEDGSTVFQKLGTAGPATDALQHRCEHLSLAQNLLLHVWLVEDTCNQVYGQA